MPEPIKIEYPELDLDNLASTLRTWLDEGLVSVSEISQAFVRLGLLANKRRIVKEQGTRRW